MSWELVLDPSLFRLTVAMSAPLVLASCGELVMERAGILNVAIEGMVTLGAAAAFLAGFASGRTELALLAGAAAGAVVAAVLATYAVTWGRDQVTVGLTLYVLCLGLSSLLYRVLVGVRLTPPRVEGLPEVALPLLSGIPVLGEILFRQHGLVYGAWAVVVVTHVFLFRTAWGLRLRSAGENPTAADAVGIDVFGLRFAATVAGGALIGLAGAALPLTVTGTFTEGIAGGRGWIALMLVIFGRWVPQGVLAGALLFAYVEALQFKVALVAKAIPPQFLQMLPYAFAVAALVGATRGAVAPQALGRPYDREARA
ncbi:MAG: ABC transporter permease [candidate division GAL15 bacterium]